MSYMKGSRITWETIYGTRHERNFPVARVGGEFLLSLLTEKEIRTIEAKETLYRKDLRTGEIYGEEPGAEFSRHGSGTLFTGRDGTVLGIPYRAE